MQQIAINYLMQQFNQRKKKKKEEEEPTQKQI